MVEKNWLLKNKEMFLCLLYKWKFVISINVCNFRWFLFFFLGMVKVFCGINWYYLWINLGISSDIKIIVIELYMLFCWNFLCRDLEL